MTDSSVSFNPNGQDTILPAPAPEAIDQLEKSIGDPQLLRNVASRYPRLVDAWAELAKQEEDPISKYAFARVGYHRGLDQLRAAGWKGSGYVRWSEATNRGFLCCVYYLGEAASLIGEDDEATRCEMFLRQLDPNWSPANVTQ